MELSASSDQTQSVVTIANTINSQSPSIINKRLELLKRRSRVRRRSRFLNKTMKPQASPKNSKMFFKTRKKVERLISHSYEKGSFAKKESTPRTRKKNITLVRKYRRKMFALSEDFNSNRNGEYFKRSRDEIKEMIMRSRRKSSHSNVSVSNDDFRIKRSDNSNKYIGSEGSPKFYLKYRKLTMSYAKNLKMSKSKRTKNYVPDILKEFEKRKVLPLKSGIVKLKGVPTEFNANYYRLGKNYCESIAESFSSPFFKTIKLKDNRLDEETAIKILSKINTLCKKIDLTKNRVGKKGIEKITELLYGNYSNLTHLILANNDLKSDFVTPMFNTIENYNNLIYLDLSNNKLDDHCCSDLGQTIFASGTLRELYLHWNLISAEGFSQLLDNLTDHKSVIAADFSCNKIGKNFDQSHCNFLKKLLRRNNYLAHLDLSSNSISHDYFNQIQKALNSNSTILGLHIEGNFSGAYMDPFGYLKRDEKKCFYYSIQGQQNLKRIKGVKCVNLRCRSNYYIGTRNCWICEGWSEQRFELDPGKVKGKTRWVGTKGRDVLVHLSFLGFEGKKMEKVLGVYEFRLMCPPGRIKYFFSVGKNIYYDEDELTVKYLASFRPSTSIDEEIEVKEVNEYELEAKESIFQPGNIKLITTQPRAQTAVKVNYEYNPSDKGFSLDLSKIRQYDFLSKKDETFFNQISKNFKVNFNYKHLLNYDNTQIEQFFLYLDTVIPSLYRLFRFFIGKNKIETKHTSEFFARGEVIQQMFKQIGYIFDAENFTVKFFYEFFDTFTTNKPTIKKDTVNFEEFLELLFEISSLFMIKTKLASNLHSAFTLFLEDYRVLTFASLIKDPTPWRQKTFVSKEITFLISFYHDTLLKLYQEHIKLQNSHHIEGLSYQDSFTMDQKSFLLMVKKLRLKSLCERVEIDVLNKEKNEEKFHMDYEDLVLEDEAVRLCFGDSVRFKVVGSGLENLPLIIFPEFIEAFLRLGNIYRMHKLKLKGNIYRRGGYRAKLAFDKKNEFFRYVEALLYYASKEMDMDKQLGLDGYSAFE